MTEQDIFLAAVEISDPPARQAYLEQACTGNPALRQQVEALLKVHATAGDFLATPAVEQLSAKTTASNSSTGPAAGSAEFEKTHGYTQDVPAGDDAVSLDFLSPSDKAGSLGRLGHYEVHELLGHGAFGIVLKAFDEKLHRMVAIKVLSPELAKSSPPRKRFLREARSAAAIRHEHVVAIYAVEEQPIPYLVMEYIPGITMEQALHDHGPLDVADVLRLGQQIAAGLAAAHAQGLIHRDIKPSNILLENGLSGRVKITDFGLARTADDASMTQSGTIAGTPLYMSPEQATSGDIDQRSDLFSLGSVLYVMVSGRPPFRAATMLAVLKRVVEDTPRPIPTIIADTPGWLCAIIVKLQAKQPEERFATASEVADLLGRCLADLQANRPVQLPAGMQVAEVKVTAIVEPEPPLIASETAFSQPQTLAPSHPRISSRRPWPTIAAAALILLVGLGLTEATGVTKLTSTVIRLTTGSGTLVIETDDPGVKVTIDGEEVRIQGAGVEQLTLKPGQYKIAAVKDGRAVSQELVTITRGGKEVVRVTMEGIATVSTVSRDPEGSAISSDDPDRRAAEWALSVGGDVWVWINNGYVHCPTKDLLPKEPFLLKYVFLQKTNTEIVDADLANLQQCAHLEQLQLVDTKVTGSGLAYLKNCLKLDSLWMSGSKVTDAGLSHLPRHETLKNLVLSNTDIGDEAIKSLQDFQNLEMLNLLNTRVTDKGLLPLRQCAKLRHLLVNGRGVTDASLSNCEHWQDLKELYLNGSQVTDQGLQKLKHCKKLSILVLAQTPITDEGLVTLREIKTLITLAITGTKVTEAGVKQLASALPKCGIEWDGGVIEPASADGWHGWPADAPKPAIAPFDTEQAKKHQEAWSKYLNVPVEYTNSIGMKFRLIPPGEFLMGSTEEEIERILNESGPVSSYVNFIKSEEPQHKVILTRPFYLCIHETTQREYETIVGMNPSSFSARGEGKNQISVENTDQYPVENVTWKDAVDFCKRLTQKEGFVPASKHFRVIDTSPKALGYRLPTEAEWEFACRGGTVTRHLWGQQGDYDKFEQYGWANFNSGGSVHRVEELNENPFGLFDIYGNVEEYCFDRWIVDQYQQSDGNLAIDPVASEDFDSDEHVLRGGSWSQWTFNCSSASRVGHHDARSIFGFRVALSVDAVKQALKLPKPVTPADPPATSDATKPQPAELVLPHLKGQPYPTRTAATWEPGPKENTIPGLIPRPAKLDGVVRWQIETIAPRSAMKQTIAMSPDYKIVACAADATSDKSLPCTVRVYSTATGELLHLFPHPAGVWSISWHKASQQFATGCVDGKLRIWTIEGKRTVEWQAHKDHAYVTWSPDGEWLATHRIFVDNASDTAIRTWKPDGTAGPAETLEAAGIENLAWSADSKRLAVIADQSPRGYAYHLTAHLIHLAGDKAESIRLKEIPDLKCLAWHPDGQRVALLSTKMNDSNVEGTIRILNVGGDTVSEWKFDVVNGNAAMPRIAWSPDGKVLGAVLYSHVGLWNADGSAVAALQATGGISTPGNTKSFLRWSPDSQYVVFDDLSVFQADGSVVKLPSYAWPIAGWAANSELIFALSPHHGLIRWHREGKDFTELFSGPLPNPPSPTHWIEKMTYPWNQGWTQSRWHARSPAFLGPSTYSFRWWTLDGRPGPDLATRNRDFTLPNHNFNVGCSPDGTHILQSFPNGIIVRDHHRIVGDRRFPFAFHGNPIWSPDGKQVACKTSDGVKIITLDSPNIVELAGTKGVVHDVDWSPDGQWVSTGEDLKIRFWKPDGTPGSVLTLPDNAMNVVWHPDSRQIAVIVNGLTQIYNLDGTPGLTLRTPSPYYCSHNAGWSSDGQLFVGAIQTVYKEPSQLVAWNAEDGTIAWTAALQPLHAHRLGSIEWHSDGTHLMTQSMDGTCGVWNGRTGELQFVIASANQTEVFSFDTAGQLLHGNPTRLDAWFRCVVEDADGNFMTLKPSEFLQEHAEFTTAGSWPEDGKPTDPERKAAARLLGIGCTLGIYVGGIAKKVKAIDDLPRERFSIAMITGPLADGDLVWLHRNRQTFEELFRLELTAGSNADQGLKLLKEFPSLWSMRVVHPEKLGPGLELPQLTELSLIGNNITDETIAHLKAIPDLYDLILSSTPAITDEAVDTLEKLSKLRILNLTGTKISPDGVARLKAALPLCEVQGP